MSLMFSSSPVDEHGVSGYRLGPRSWG